MLEENPELGEARRKGDVRDWVKGVERQLSILRVIVGVLFMLVIAAGFTIPMLWKERDDHKFRLSVIEDFLDREFPSSPPSGQP